MHGARPALCPRRPAGPQRADDKPRLPLLTLAFNPRSGHPADMATQKETVAFILAKLRQSGRFEARAMFGEYALYADGKVVALVCDDRLFVKILPASRELEPLCEQAPPYPGAKPHYLVEEGQLSSLPVLPAILCALAASLPEKKRRASARVGKLPRPKK